MQVEIEKMEAGRKQTKFGPVKASEQLKEQVQFSIVYFCREIQKMKEANE